METPAIRYVAPSDPATIRYADPSDPATDMTKLQGSPPPGLYLYLFYETCICFMTLEASRFTATRNPMVDKSNALQVLDKMPQRNFIRSFIGSVMKNPQGQSSVRSLDIGMKVYLVS
ncbi:hypothetical protein L2E82_48903 [Cichorium intybus]|uniref:Uncharacterized protein n=1 Tax=Cichorium intybus TaxID=13427 RepID=A0ACB8Z0G0_CICIN|nr:hypothetical protein L2E82_48903 [Cichorium intybus]